MKKIKSETYEANATVAEVFPKLCRVITDSADQNLLCSYRRKEVFGRFGKNWKEKSPVAVGDRVKALILGKTDGIIENVIPRHNQLVRLAPGKDRIKGSVLVHVVAVNVDLLVIVASVKNPDFSLGLVDRYLVAAQSASISVLLCINKVDLLENFEIKKSWELYEKLGIQILYVSTKKETGIEELKKAIENKRSVFCGHSGVGKTSLLRVLLQEKIGKTEETNPITGKGRHATTSAVLFKTQQGFEIIDTPGVREFNLFGVEPNELGLFFPEFQSLECTQKKKCLHENEEKCQAKELPRYQSYLKILNSLKEHQKAKLGRKSLWQ